MFFPSKINVDFFSHALYFYPKDSLATIATYKISSPVYDILLLDSPLDIASLLSKSTTDGKGIKSASAEVYLVVNSNIGDAESLDKGTVKVVTFDLLSEKVRKDGIYKIFTSWFSLK